MIIVQRLGGGVRLVFGNLVFVFLVMLRLALATHRRPAVIDEHFFLFAVGGFGMGFGLVAFGLRGGIQRHQRRHHGLFAAVGLVFFLFLLGGGIGFGSGDLEAFDIVFRTATGFGFLLGQQGLPVGHGNLVIVWVDFGEGQEALAVAAIFDKGGLQRRLNPRHFRKIDVSLERPPRGSLEIKFLDLGTVENDHPCFFRVVGVDKHALVHEILRRARAWGRAHAMVRRAPFHRKL